MCYFVKLKNYYTAETTRWYVLRKSALSLHGLSLFTLLPHPILVLNLRDPL